MSFPTTAAIRQYLTAAYSDDDLTALCADYFRDVADTFAAGMTKTQKIHLLLDHCQRRDLLPNLLAALERDRPAQFQTRLATPLLSPAPPHPERTLSEAAAESKGQSKDPPHGVPAPRLRDPRQIFISHAHEDADSAHRLAADLHAHGWRTWIAPDNIRPGEKWGEAISRGLEECGVFVIILTPAAVQSRWVTTETTLAIELEHKDLLRLIPVEVKNCHPPLLWTAYQRIPFTEHYESGLTTLLRELERTDPPTGAESPQSPADPKITVPRPTSLPQWLWPSRAIVAAAVFLTIVLIFVLKTPGIFTLITPTPTATPTPTPTPPQTPLEVGLCGSGQPISVTNPMGPGNFDYQFGYTFYNTNNSRELALNAIRSLLADDNGLWVGYGAISNGGKGGVSFVSHNLQGYRLWEYCTNIQGKPIGHRSHALAKGKDGALWVASDGQGVWRLQRGKWEQFIYDPYVNDGRPSPATYALAASDNNMLVGTQNGITRWTGATWEHILFNKQVHALAVGARGRVWVGYITEGVSRNPWDNNRQDYNIANGALASNAVRSIVIDQQERVWVGTDGGGLSVFDNGQWRTYQASNSGLLSDTVKAVAIDKYERVWVGTGKGASYFDGTSWHTYTTISTSAIAFAKVPNKSCSLEEIAWDVWIGTDDKGLLNSRLPANSPVVASVSVSDVPATLRSGQIFTPSVTITLEKDYKLTQGDFLQALNDNSYTSNPSVGLPEGVVVKGGQAYTFNFARNPMKAPEQNGTYRTTWRLWQCGRYVGQPIEIEFTVNNP